MFIIQFINAGKDYIVEIVIVSAQAIITIYRISSLSKKNFNIPVKIYTQKYESIKLIKFKELIQNNCSNNTEMLRNDWC